MREVVANLRREPHECVSEATRVYLGDLYDHVIQIIEIVETYREMASDLTETVIRMGMPIKSASLNFTPGLSSRSSYSTSMPACSSAS
jgi:hypothetical protein